MEYFKTSGRTANFLIVYGCYPPEWFEVALRQDFRSEASQAHYEDMARRLLSSEAHRDAIKVGDHPGLTCLQVVMNSQHPRIEDKIRVCALILEDISYEIPITG